MSFLPHIVRRSTVTCIPCYFKKHIQSFHTRLLARADVACLAHLRI